MIILLSFCYGLYIGFGAVIYFYSLHIFYCHQQPTSLRESCSWPATSLVQSIIAYISVNSFSEPWVVFFSGHETFKSGVFLCFQLYYFMEVAFRIIIASLSQPLPHKEL